jgi:hypothetical protein
MEGLKAFLGNLPRTGRQRSAEQVSARLNDLLSYVNEIFAFSTAPNFGKVLGFNSTTGEIDVFSVLKYTGNVPNNNVLVGDGTGALIPNFAVTGTAKRYNIGPDGTNGQLAVTNGAGSITFQNPPVSSSWVDQAGNFTVTPNVNYNIDDGAQITILTANVVPGFQFSVRPKYGENFFNNPPVVLYNGVDPIENTTENLELDIQAEYLIYSQNGTNIQISVKGISENV